MRAPPRPLCRPQPCGLTSCRRTQTVTTHRSPMLDRLLPRDDQFFELFDQLAGHLASSAKMLDALFGDVQHVSEHVRAIKDVEHKADLLTATINQRIDKSFITPIDREDIHT